jgi:hypothetical protein
LPLLGGGIPRTPSDGSIPKELPAVAKASEGILLRSQLRPCPPKLAQRRRMVELTRIEPAAAFGVVRRGAYLAGGFAPQTPGGRRFDPAAARLRKLIAKI